MILNLNKIIYIEHPIHYYKHISSMNFKKITEHLLEYKLLGVLTVFLITENFQF